MKKLICAAIFLAALSARAESNPQMVEFFKSEITKVNSAVVALPEDHHDRENPGWPLRHFMLQIQAKFGIEVPWVAKFLIVPEVELVWVKDMK
ncbi:MAG: hypothetical protein H6624_01935 [Bdellovibrionaceae bacterium]|nr:hypothetical protein [Bdellovibrionales bacterium]MCB9083069.1 hypothetical protein [Pseudobdellovibrionaceae bacterium]